MSVASIRFLQAADVPAILEIQAHSPEATQWSRSAYEELMSTAGVEAWVAEREERIAGFLIVRVAADEMEILNLAVEPAARCRSVGRALLQGALWWALQNSARRAFLEVRFSNAVARQFYEAHGFAPAGTRPNYYTDPGEDALVLVRNLDGK